MILLNLTPLEELDNPFWYIPEVVILSLVLLGGCTVSDKLIGSYEMEVAQLSAQTAEAQSNHAKIKPELAKFNSLNDDINKLKKTTESLRVITASKLEKYKPVVLLEHLHNLKPEGMWFDQIEEKTEEKTIVVRGNSFDPILVSEFISALNATSAQSSVFSDIRTQVVFDKTDLKFVRLRVQSDAKLDFPELEGSVVFELLVHYMTRESSNTNESASEPFAFIENIKNSRF